jgi:endonuclease III
MTQLYKAMTTGLILTKSDWLKATKMAENEFSDLIRSLDLKIWKAKNLKELVKILKTADEIMGYSL